LPVDAASVTRELSLLLHDEQFLGCLVQTPYKQTALAYCQELTHSAQLLGGVNVMTRRSTGLVYGDNTDVHAFAASLADAGVRRVRTALVLGAGQAARIALAGLRDLNCARYLVGFRNPRRPAELNSQLRALRKQLSFFPLREMDEFFGWADRTGLFAEREPLLAPGVRDDTIKRWDLLVNATPVGCNDDDVPLVSNVSFLRSFERVFDMVPRADGTALTRSAESAGVPALTGARLVQHAQQQALDIWEREYRRRVHAGGDGQAELVDPQQRYGRGAGGGLQGRVPVLKRRRR
jgi:shikimate dehydrogenase